MDDPAASGEAAAILPPIPTTPDLARRLRDRGTDLDLAVVARLEALHTCVETVRKSVAAWPGTLSPTRIPAALDAVDRETALAATPGGGA